MRILVKFLSITLVSVLFLASCQKELSLEGGSVPGGGTALGELAGDSSTCANITVSGVYGVGLVLTDSNKVEVEINFTQPGTYVISTDTVNGIYFTKSGIITTPGITRITLEGSGTPTVVGVYPFTVSFKDSYCTFGLNVYEVATATNDDYFPTSTASNWTYLSSDPGATPADTILVTSTGTSANIGANTYSVFTQKGGFGLDSAFYRKGSGNYHTITDIDAAGITTSITPVEYIILKDNVAVGTTWESPEAAANIDTVSVKIKLSLAIAEKNVNILLDNKVYQNVIKVRTTELILVPGTSYAPVISYESWYAKGIGLINIVAPAPAYGFLVSRYKVN
jgi:hypothetical protein